MTEATPLPTMYLPRQFASQDVQHALTVMRQHPLASVTAVDEGGFPFVSYIPLHAEHRPEAGGAGLTLWGHCSRGNPHWKLLQQSPQALVAFRGAQAYLSPSVYPDLERVPSWNYVAVHCRVQVELIDQLEDKDRLLKCLIGDHEPAYAEQWRGLDADFTRKLLGGVVGLRMQVLQWECKLKLNQHRPESYAALRAAYETHAELGDDDAHELLQWMDRLGMRETEEAAR